MSEHANPPSRVIHFRNVGPDVTQHDLLVLATGFGSVEQVLMLKSKNQALLQFTELPSAMNFMQYYSTVQANIRGRNVYPQYSSHQELSSSTGVISTQQTSSGDPTANGNPGTPNRILLVTINNAIYPITVDILYQVFGSHGLVEKIVIFNKTKGLQALVQYANIPSATSAKESLHGQNIYTNGSCQLHIQYSNLSSELTVTANNDRTKDFTKPLPAIAPEVQSSGIAPVRAPGMQSAGIPVGGPAQFVPGMGGMGGAPDFYAQQAAQQFMPNAFMGGQFNSVLLVSNLNEEKINCTQLFNLFSCYGNVLRMKILHNKPDHALIQMADYYQASTAMHYLKGLTLWEKPMDINFSKHAYINATSQDPADPSCADYTNSPLNRFKFHQGTEKAQQIYKNMSGPVALLHISNLPASSTNASVTEMFSQFGAITGIKVFDINGKRQALVQFDSVAHGAEALVTLHNSQVDGRGLKISFSKNKL